MSQSTIVAASFSQVLIATNELIARGDYKKAVAECDNLISMYPDAIRAQRARANALERLGDAAHALEDYRHVLEIMPTDHYAMIGMARCHKKLGEVRDAEWLARQVIDYDPDDLDAARLANMSDLEIRRAGDIRYARDLCLAGMPMRGISEIRRKLAAEPDRVDLQLVLAELLWTGKQHIVVAELCYEILHTLPDCLPAHLLLRTLWHKANAEVMGAAHHLHIERLDPGALEAQAWLQGSLPVTAQVEFWDNLTIAGSAKNKPQVIDEVIEDDPHLASDPLNQNRADDVSNTQEDDLYAIPSIEATDFEPDLSPSDITAPKTPSILDQDPPEEAIEVEVDVAVEADDHPEAWISDLIYSNSPQPIVSNDTSTLNEIDEINDGPVEIPEPLQWSVVYDSETDLDDLAPKKPVELATKNEPEPEWLANLRVQSGSVWVPANSEPTQIKPDASEVKPPTIAQPDSVDKSAIQPPDTDTVKANADPVTAIKSPVPAKRPKRPGKKDLAALEQLTIARQTLAAGKINEGTVLYTQIIKNGRKLDDVIQDLSNAVKASQYSARLYRLLGDAYTKQGNVNAALAAYQQGLRKRIK